MTQEQNDVIEELQPIQYQIIKVIVDILTLLGAPVEVIGTVGSWGDTLPQEDVLSLLKEDAENIFRKPNLLQK